MKYMICTLVLSILTLSTQAFAAQADDLPPRLRVKTLFENSKTPAALQDFKASPGSEQKCLVYPPYQSKLYSHPAQFHVFDIEISPKTPIFPNGLYQPTLQSSFRGWIRFSLNAEYHFMRTDQNEFYVKNWSEIGLADERGSYAWLEYKFRKSGNVIVFTMKVNETKKLSYGYCWNEELK